MPSILLILHQTSLELRDTTATLAEQHRLPTSQEALLSYLILEQYRVVDWGALALLVAFDDILDSLGENNYRINITTSAKRMLVHIKKALKHCASCDAIGNFILQENLPLVRMYPELYPGLQFLQSPRRNRGLSKVRDHRYPTPVYASLHEAYRVATKAVDAQELSEKIYQAFSALTVMDLELFLAGPTWEAFLEVEYDDDQERRVRIPNDFASYMVKVAEHRQVPVIRIASYVLWLDLRAVNLPNLEGAPSLEALMTYTMSGEYLIAE